jgi:hypothetical protein
MQEDYSEVGALEMGGGQPGIMIHKYTWNSLAMITSSRFTTTNALRCATPARREEETTHPPSLPTVPYRGATAPTAARPWPYHVPIESTGSCPWPSEFRSPPPGRTYPRQRRGVVIIENNSFIKSSSRAGIDRHVRPARTEKAAPARCLAAS